MWKTMCCTFVYAAEHSSCNQVISGGIIEIISSYLYLLHNDGWMFKRSTFFSRLEVYDLVELKVSGDGNCQVSLFSLLITSC